MDCNREEALRAKQIAEKKMENKDFSAALKIAQKAQQLYPDLENVSQMILVCEVHCSAEKKAYGTEKDWYSILKIEPTADDLAIKKQYRKLALVLHPDKNKFSGSSDAFKLIGEAQRVLLDREKRIIHDGRRKASGNFSATTNWYPRQPNAHPRPWTQGHSGNSQFQNSFPAGGNPVNLHFPHPRPQPQTGFAQNRTTFWTVCPFCKVRYQFYKQDVLNKVIPCQGCRKSFTAYEFNAHGVNPPPPPFPQPNMFSFKGAESTNRGFTTKPVFEGDNRRSKDPPRAQGNVNRKRKKKVEESSESSDNEESSESEGPVDVPSESSAKETGSESDEDVVVEDGFAPSQDFQCFGEPPRRSSRPKRNVSYTENLGENDDKVEDTLPKADEKDQAEELKPDSRGVENEEDGEEPTMEPEVFTCPDPDFSDFDKDRKEESFRQGQIWAVYDTEDAMPRFYAFVRKVSSPGFRLQITWLEPVPGNKDESKWVHNDYPFSSGLFKRGKPDKAEDLPMFSHVMPWDKGVQKDTYKIYPRTGETWAVFKNWSLKWCVMAQNGTRDYEYEFVEVLSDYDDNEGAAVSFLEKVSGFTCLFGRKLGEATRIPAGERLRFSHMVPSRRMSGEEREGVPKGCYELDPAGLPASTFEQVGL